MNPADLAKAVDGRPVFDGQPPGVYIFRHGIRRLTLDAMDPHHGGQHAVAARNVNHTAATSSKSARNTKGARAADVVVLCRLWREAGTAT